MQYATFYTEIFCWKLSILKSTTNNINFITLTTCSIQICSNIIKTGIVCSSHFHIDIISKLHVTDVDNSPLQFTVPVTSASAGEEGLWGGGVGGEVTAINSFTSPYLGSVDRETPCNNSEPYDWNA